MTWPPIKDTAVRDIVVQLLKWGYLLSTVSRSAGNILPLRMSLVRLQSKVAVAEPKVLRAYRICHKNKDASAVGKTACGESTVLAF